MKSILDKIKRLMRVVQLKEFELSKEVGKLRTITIKKNADVQNLKDRQGLYITGLDKVNEERSSPLREKLMALELGLDSTKFKWAEAFQTLKKTEALELEQKQIVQLMQNEIDSIVKMVEKYQKEFTMTMNKNEQKNIDESALRRFSLKG